MQDLRDEIRGCFSGRVFLMGVGNIACGDDGLGAILSESLLDRMKGGMEFAPGHAVINAGETPERFLKAAEGFDHLIFLDAVEFKGTPGSVVFLDSEETAGRFPQVSTHRPSLGLLARLVEHSGTKAWLLGVQPGSLKQGHSLTQEVKATLEILGDMLMEMMIFKKAEI
jgi:hydrogenase maturation protease